MVVVGSMRRDGPASDGPGARTPAGETPGDIGLDPPVSNMVSFQQKFAHLSVTPSLALRLSRRLASCS